MLALDNGDKIRGDASAATVVDFTLHGVVGTVVTQLADGQLAISIGDLYTAGVAGIAVTSIILVNTDTVARTVNLYLTPSAGTARRLIPKNMSLGAGHSLYVDGKKVTVMGANGVVLANWAVDDTPVDGSTTTPISSNWAFDHAALTTTHGAVSAATASRIVVRDASARAAFAAPAAAGDVLIKGTRLTAAELLDGTLNQVLTAQGAGVNPAYAAAGGFTSKARAVAGSNQVLSTGGFRTIKFLTETYDIDSEFNNTTVTGTTTSAAASKLINTAAAFVAGDVGRWVHNTTDNTYAKVTAVDSSTQLSIDADIMAASEAYTLYFSKFTATTTGYYLVTATMLIQNSAASSLYYALILRSDGAEFARNTFYGTGGNLPLFVYDIIALTAGQSICIQVYPAGAPTILGSNERGFAVHRLS